MIEVAFEGISKTKPIQKLIIGAAEAVLFFLDIKGDTDVSIVIGTDAYLRSLNLEHRGEDSPTDVLSFANDFQPSEIQTSYLGDIAISLERADAQAKEGGHSVYGELQLLSVHGMLHLLGYDHATESDREAMWTLQNNILDQLGVEIDRSQIGK